MSVQDKGIRSIGRAIYRERILDCLDETDKGKFVAIDVDSGEYEISEDIVTAMLRLRSRKPDAVTWVERVGYPAAFRIGAKPRSPRHD